jgi:pyrroline-5-carboxylate reductase
MSKNRVLLVGCGAMGGALMQGWVKTAVKDFEFEIVTPNPRTDFHLLQHRSPSTYKDKADILIFAVKPQILDAIIEDYESLTSSDTIIVSIAAGKNLTFFKQYFPKNTVMRAMPNIPAAINKGVTILSEIKTCPETEIIEKLFSYVSKCFWLKENLFDSMTALTGSGPAYIYLLTETIGKLIKKQGIPENSSIEMAKHLIAGSAELMMHSKQSPEELRQAVTSPKGVTDAALKILMPDIQKLFNKAIQEATKRSKELSK